MPSEMWAQTLVAPRTFVAGNVPAPGPADLEEGEALLEVIAGGICGSDLPVFRGRMATLGTERTIIESSDGPGLPVHEVVGTVVASRHPAHEVGSMVVGWATRWNGIAEYVITEGDGLTGFDLRLPAATAVMLQPLACVLFAADRLHDVEGSRVAIIGLGPIGLLFAHVLAARGVGHVVGIDRIDRSDLADAFSIDEVVHASSDRWAQRLADADRPQLVIEAVGHQGSTLNDAVAAVGPNGRLYYFGIADDPGYSLDLAKFIRKNLTLTAGVARERRRYLEGASAYLASHPDLAESYVTDTFSALDVQQAFEVADRPAPGRIKVTFTLS